MAKPTTLTVVQAPPLLVDRVTAAAALGISDSTLEGLVRAGDLPPPRQISKARVGWLWRELQAFAEGRPVSDLSSPAKSRPAAQDDQRAA